MNQRACFLAYRHHSTTATVLHLHHTLWLHLRGMDGGRYLLLRRPLWSRLCLHPLSDVFPRNNHILAVEDHVDQEGGACDREATKASVYGSPRPLPVQCHECASRGVSDPDVQDIHPLYRSFVVQSNHPHHDRGIDPLLRRLSPPRDTRFIRSADRRAGPY